MLNSRWMMNRAGVVDFWYYDEQEFWFDQGKMLLRGSNGSGKSVTMQSIIPLLLDGNMRPERLDPFGSRDRKMINYLLEEDDNREERTGYLYLEFKREDTQTYLTIGIGLRARKGKKLDSWYFGISDGRRINKDFFLVEKKLGAKMALTKKELENRLVTGGVVLSSQTEYMAYVNQQIFGFETLDEYKEMVDLLIQLRTPKLSRDFKPSVISEILSNSLLPLSEEDLRPMAEAIESMDSISTNLKNLTESVKAGEKIARVYEHYNQVVLCNKAKQCERILQEFTLLESELIEKEKRLETWKETVENAEKTLLALQDEEDILTKEKETLTNSDVLALKRRVEELKKECIDFQRKIEEKKKKLEGKEERRRELEGEKINLEDENSRLSETLAELLGEMEDDLDFVSFDEFFFMKDELLQDVNQIYDFSAHEKQLDRYQQLVKKAYQFLENAKQQKERLEAELQILEGKKKERDHADRQLGEYTRQLEEIKNELKEKVDKWQEQTNFLQITPEFLKKVSHFIEEYEDKSDRQTLYQELNQLLFVSQSELEMQKAKLRAKLEEILKQKEEAKKEKKQWETKKESEPERSESVLKNREWLKKAKIPFEPFYKMIDFPDNMSLKERGYLEEAFLAMGILDALVIEEEYKEQVLNSELGMCDRYLFTQKGNVSSSNLSDLLEIAEPARNLFDSVKILNVLGNIKIKDVVNCQGETCIDSSTGIYTLGILTGTISKTYHASFIGVAAREAYRQSMIAKWQMEIETFEQKSEEEKEKIKQVEEKITCLNKEYEDFPNFEDLYQAGNDYAECQKKIDGICTEILRVETNAAVYQEKLKELNLEATKLARQLDLSCEYEIFEQTREILEGYRKQFYQLQTQHNAYLQKREILFNKEKNLEEIEDDLDTIRYELGRDERDLEKSNKEKISVEEQLALTGYEQVKERLDYCVKRLEEIKPERDGATRKSQEGQTQQIQLKEQLENGRKKQEALSKQKEYVLSGVQKEWELGYLSLPEEIVLDDEKKIQKNVKKLVRYLQDIIQQRRNDQKQNDCIEHLQQVVISERIHLSENDISMDKIFIEDRIENMGDFSRTNLTGKFQNKKVDFLLLLKKLQQEKQNMELLLKADEKELFENILANTVSRKIRSRINASLSWVEQMNDLMQAMNTSSGLKLSLKWRSKTAEDEQQLDTADLVSLLKKDAQLMRDEEIERLSMHFRSKVEQARRSTLDSVTPISFFSVMRDTLDYRKWFEFRLFSQKTGEKKKELTDSIFGTFSGGEKAMAMYVPLFSAVVAKYEGARKDAPRIISLDEAFAGVDNRNIRDMFRLITQFEFNYIMNSQVLWGDCDTVEHLAIYQLLRPQNAKFVTVISYLWNGKQRLMQNDMEEAIRESALTKIEEE